MKKTNQIDVNNKPKKNRLILLIILCILTSFAFFSSSYIAIQFKASEEKPPVIQNKVVEEIPAVKEVPVVEAKIVAEPPSSGVIDKPETNEKVAVKQEPVSVQEAPKQHDPGDFSNADFEAFKKRNQYFYFDFRYPALNMDFPVPWDRPGYSDFYYLTHNYDNQVDKNGTVFASKESIGFGTFNQILYGHNRADGLQFGSLRNLLKPEVFNKDGVDKFYAATSLIDSHEYKVVSILILDEDDLIYFTGGRSLSDGEKETFINRIKTENKVPRFATDDLNLTDQFITLSTCYEQGGESARLVVIGKKIN